MSVACYPGNKVGSPTGWLCILADQWNRCVCACMHDVCVCVCVDRGGESPTDEDRQDKEEKKPVVEIKPQD